MESTPPTGMHLDVAPGVERSFTTLPPRLRLSCSRSPERPVCQLLWRLEACNKLLLHLDLQLREDETDGVGDVRLVANNCARYLSGLTSEPLKLNAVDLLEWLLIEHRCLVCVELTREVVKSTRLRRALVRSPGVRKVHVKCPTIFPELECSKYPTVISEKQHSVPELIASLGHVDELVFPLSTTISNFILEGKVFGLSRAGTGLTTLDVAFVTMTEHVATELIAHLKNNSTVTRLSVSRDVFGRESFMQYLAKDNPTLKALALHSSQSCGEEFLQRLVSAIVSATTLEELTAMTEHGGKEDVPIFAQVVSRSSTVRRVCFMWQMSWPTGEWSYHFIAWTKTGSHPETISAWLPSLARSCALKRTSMSFFGFGETACNAVLRALLQNKTNTDVTAVNLRMRTDLKELCATIRECGFAHTLLVYKFRLESTSIPILTDCPEAIAVAVSQLPRDGDFSNVLSVLGSSSHVSSVSFSMAEEFFNEAVHRQLVAFIERAVNLKVLRLSLGDCFRAETRDHHRDTQSAVVKAIASNTSLRAIALKGLRLADSDCEMLAEAAVRGPYLNDMEVDFEKGNLFFLQHLAAVAASSCNVLRIEVSDFSGAEKELFAVKEVTRRNSGLFIRAARFVLGDGTKYCARALEFVSAHPILVEMIQDSSTASCDVAKEMIRRALSRIASMDQFMRVTGVVKDRVKCCARRDRQTQLDELNEDCWLHVRKYLKVGDVLEPPLVSV